MTLRPRALHRPLALAAIWLVGRSERLSRYSYPIGLILGALLVPLAGLDSVALVGDTTVIPRSVPEIQLPDLSLISGMIIPALAISIIGLVQAVGVSQSVPKTAEKTITEAGVIGRVMKTAITTARSA